MDPFDRSFWGRVRSPLWVSFTILMLIPMPYVSAPAFLFFFLLIDKMDEYQLCHFILVGKTFGFYSQGVIRVLIGYFMYLDCVTAVADEDHHACQRRGPGHLGPVWLILAGWSLHIVLNWLAPLGMVPCGRRPPWVSGRHSSSVVGL